MMFLAPWWSRVLLFVLTVSHAVVFSFCLSPRFLQAHRLHHSQIFHNNGPDGVDVPAVSRSDFLHQSAQCFLSVAFLPQAESSSQSMPPSTSDAKSPSALQESISGLIAGSTLTLTKSIVKYPLDTAAVRLQMPQSEYSIFRPVSLFQGAYRGFWAPLLINVPAGAVFFAVKDAAKQLLHSRDSSPFYLPRWAQTSLAIAFAQVPYWLVRSPSEVVKTRQQAGIQGFGEGVPVWEAYRKVLSDSLAKQSNASGTTATFGLEGFYVGYWENILYAYPADVLKFICYDWLLGDATHVSPLDGAWAGAVSTALAQFVTTPLDVVRNRVMTQETQSKVSSVAPTDSYLQSLVKLAQQEGFSGLFAGSSPRVGKALLSGAIQFATYEETKQTVMKILGPMGG